MKYAKMLVSRVSEDFYAEIEKIAKESGNRKLSDTVRSLLEEAVKARKVKA
jgi:hypothetical protein